jgi:plastocyanin
MTRAVALAVSLAAVALLGAADGSSAPAQNPQIFGTVGPDFDIVLKDAQGNQVTKLDKGTFEIQIEDLSDSHNFHLRGPGVDQRTAIGFTGTVTWTVSFTDGTFAYYCEPHSSTMRGAFTAGNPVVATPPPTTVVTPKSKLVLISGPKFVITLKTAAGKTVKKMKRGTYRMLVRDRSQAHNAHVRAPGFDKKTTLPFVGSQTWKVKLARVGTFRFLCDPHASTGMRGSAKIVR